MSKFISEKLKAILAPYYKLNRDKSEITHITCPDTSVVLATRNTLSTNNQAEAFPPVTPNFVAEICSDNDSWDYCHNKMLDYMASGVDEGILIDPLDQTLTWYRINGNNVVWRTRNNPSTFRSRILNGFTLNLHAPSLAHNDDDVGNPRNIGANMATSTTQSPSYKVDNQQFSRNAEEIQMVSDDLWPRVCSTSPIEGVDEEFLLFRLQLEIFILRILSNESSSRPSTATHIFTHCLRDI
ncbi:hypothetical protein RhiirA4_538118 [Rhizophagus irregularis]|uniref:Putative restriction endonuclease domain-containing protein n=1 Tax=Rhizophagus irregularis TaxID=588596 RepID=A0A2I1FYJ5_9GLOM|nr:hypothetical protein RhiirA4_538118 [Rhizophagus irregularis]